MNIKAPCKGCEERTAECHCTCEKYRRFALQKKLEREKRNEKNENTYRRPDNIDKKFKAMGKTNFVFKSHKK